MPIIQSRRRFVTNLALAGAAGLGGVGAAGGLERAEVLAELHLLVVVHVLVAEQQHGMLLEGGANGSELALRQLAGDVDARDFRAEQRMELLDGDGAGIAHRLVFQSTIA